MAVVAGRLGCCGWLCLFLCSQALCVHGRGGPWLVFSCCNSKGNRVWICREAGWEAGCSSLPLHYLWLTYFSGALLRRGESWVEYRANHSLTVVSWWVELGVWFPNAVHIPPKHLHKTNTNWPQSYQVCLLTHPLTSVMSLLMRVVHARACATWTHLWIQYEREFTGDLVVDIWDHIQRIAQHLHGRSELPNTKTKDLRYQREVFILFRVSLLHLCHCFVAVLLSFPTFL